MNKNYKNYSPNFIIDDGSCIGFNNQHHIKDSSIIEIYPQPAISQIFINTSNIVDDTNNEIIIRDMLGKIIMIQPFTTISNHLLKLDVSDLSTGSYFLTMTVNNLVVTKKIVIE